MMFFQSGRSKQSGPSKGNVDHQSFRQSSAFIDDGLQIGTVRLYVRRWN